MAFIAFCAVGASSWAAGSMTFREQRNSYNKPKATPKPAAPSGKAASKAPNVSIGKAPAKKTSGPWKRSGSGSSTSLSLPGIGRSNTLYLEPSEGLFVTGEEFDTVVMFSNPKASTPDAIRIALRYDPLILMPTGVKNDAIAPYLAKPEDFRARVFAEKGQVLIEATLTQMPAMAWFEAATVRWAALDRSRSAKIDFMIGGPEATFVHAGGESILGDALLETHGVLGAEFVVVDSGEYEDGEEPLTESVTADTYLDTFVRDRDQKLGLRLQAPRHSIKVGERFFVDVLLENPHGARLDSLNLVIDFDADVLQVEDCDQDNWIEKGTNIFDGYYHERYPFDLHFGNRAYNALGEVHYSVGVSKADQIFPSGKIASILFSATRPAPKTAIDLRMAKNEIDKRTEVTYLGKSALPEPPYGLIGTTLRIMP